jgi:myo-inositol 2-dehydrogenase/D-chiro-inositol 1-dehydrogenase
MPRKIGTAVIGLGAIGPTHAHWCASIPESELKAVCDIDGKRARDVADRLGADGHTDYAEVLERRDVDAVIIATPTFLHAPMAIDAASAGKHVAVEKPLCLNLDEADAVIMAAQSAGVHAQYFENLCFSPSYRQAKEIIDAGGIGDVLFARCCESAGGGAKAQVEVYEAAETGKEAGGEAAPFGAWTLDYDKSGGGALMSTACHCIMYLRYVLNREPATRVYAELMNVVSSDPRMDDAAYVTIRYGGGQVGSVDSSIVHALGTFDDRAEIHGTEGTIFLDLYRSGAIRVYSQSGYGQIGASMFGSIPGSNFNWSYPISDERWSLGYAAELRHFLEAISADQEPEITLQDGRATLEVVLAGYESAFAGAPVSLPLGGNATAPA